MKKIILLFCCLVLTLSTLNLYGNVLAQHVVLETNLPGDGIIGIQYANSSKNRIKVWIEKDENKYIYNMINEKEYFPLQMGDGNYTIKLLENIEGNKYREIFRDTIRLEVAEEKNVFLASVQMIGWDPAMEAIKKAQALTKGAKSNKEKVERIYEFIINNIGYDFVKAGDIKPPYIPDIEKTFREKKGICYDHASLFAAMLRSVDVPAKMVKGYSQNTKEYHAWNEVYLESIKKWVTIDTALDVGYNKAGIKFEMIKDAGAYNKIREY